MSTTADKIKETMQEILNREVEKLKDQENERPEEESDSQEE